jgi:hypothetical protein
LEDIKTKGMVQVIAVTHDDAVEEV